MPTGNVTGYSQRGGGMSGTDKPDTNIELAFQRTRMASERTLMATLRTSISLIGFGFTIFQFFSRLKEADLLVGSVHAPRYLGMVMVFLGNALLFAGLTDHLAFTKEFRLRFSHLAGDGLTKSPAARWRSPTLAVSALFLVAGILAIVSMSAGWPN
jgi:putative membrane protein